MRGHQLEAPLQALQLSPTNRRFSRDELLTSPNKTPAASGRTWPTTRFPATAEGCGCENMVEAICESSAKMRRGASGRPIGLDEDNNPSPTRTKKRDVTPPPERQHQALDDAPLCNPRVIALRSTSRRVTRHIASRHIASLRVTSYVSRVKRVT